MCARLTGRTMAGLEGLKGSLGAGGGGSGSLVKGQGVVLGRQQEDLVRVSVGLGSLPGSC